MTESSDSAAAKEWADSYRRLAIYATQPIKATEAMADAFLAGVKHKEAEMLPDLKLAHTDMAKMADELNKRDAAIAVMREALESIKELDGKFGCESSDEAIEALAHSDRILEKQED